MRSFYIYGYSPSSLQQKDICVLQYDESIIKDKSKEELEAYEAAGITDTASAPRLSAAGSSCTVIPWRFIEVWPSNHWTAPFVTGHTYYMRWEYGLDFDQLQFYVEEHNWDSIYDKDIKLEMPFYAARSDITVTDNKGNIIANETLDMEAEHNQYGANNVYNETFEDDVMIPEQERRF